MLRVAAVQRLDVTVLLTDVHVLSHGSARIVHADALCAEADAAQRAAEAADVVATVEAAATIERDRLDRRPAMATPVLPKLKRGSLGASVTGGATERRAVRSSAQQLALAAAAASVVSPRAAVNARAASVVNMRAARTQVAFSSSLASHPQQHQQQQQQQQQARSAREERRGAASPPRRSPGGVAVSPKAANTDDRLHATAARRVRRHVRLVLCLGPDTGAQGRSALREVCTGTSALGAHMHAQWVGGWPDDALLAVATSELEQAGPSLALEDEHNEQDDDACSLCSAELNDAGPSTRTEAGALRNSGEGSDEGVDLATQALSLATSLDDSLTLATDRGGAPRASTAVTSALLAAHAELLPRGPTGTVLPILTTRTILTALAPRPSFSRGGQGLRPTSAANDREGEVPLGVRVAVFLVGAHRAAEAHRRRAAGAAAAAGGAPPAPVRPSALATAALAWASLVRAGEERLAGAEARIDSALAKLGEAEVDARALAETALKQKKQVERSGEQLSDMLRLISLTTAEAQRRKGVLAISKRLLTDNAERLARTRRERLDGLGEVVSLMELANEAVASIADKELHALRTAKNPPELAKLVLDCIHLLRALPLEPFALAEREPSKSEQNAMRARELKGMPPLPPLTVVASWAETKVKVIL
ncbi:hypothetical protein T492DRAFT_839019 [Pavlovales sp. CCMP2436]|nr:hypothetical protein T492DRAFT_839019 [Pavlovales sp. CCMP2436]